MTQLGWKRGISALGISLAVAVTVMASSSEAQPQPLPQYPGTQYSPPPGPQYQNPQYQTPPGPQYQNPQYPAPPPQYGRQGQNGYGPGFNRAPGNGAGADNRLDRRLAMLHQRLGITPAQEAAWTAFAGEMRNMEMQVRETMPNRERGAGNIVQRLELRQRMLERRSADLDGMLRALRPLYASLSDEQKRAADRVLFRPERRGNAGGPGFRNAPPPSGYGPGFAPGYNRTPG
jgi:hypothetical protein